MVSPDPAHVRFVGYGVYSKDVLILCYLRWTEQDEFIAAQEDLMLRMGDIVREAGSGFAFPSQTTYLAHDSVLGAEEGAKQKHHGTNTNMRTGGAG